MRVILIIAAIFLISCVDTRPQPSDTIALTVQDVEILLERIEELEEKKCSIWEQEI